MNPYLKQVHSFLDTVVSKYHICITHNLCVSAFVVSCLIQCLTLSDKRRATKSDIQTKHFFSQIPFNVR